jgi:hypothetical protein
VIVINSQNNITVIRALITVILFCEYTNISWNISCVVWFGLIGLFFWLVFIETQHFNNRRRICQPDPSDEYTNISWKRGVRLLGRYRQRPSNATINPNLHNSEVCAEIGVRSGLVSLVVGTWSWECQCVQWVGLSKKSIIYGSSCVIITELCGAFRRQQLHMLLWNQFLPLIELSVCSADPFHVHLEQHENTRKWPHFVGTTKLRTHEND